jgi:hypothetical protein
MKSLSTVSALLFALGLAAAGCGGSSGSGTTQTTTSTTTQSTVATSGSTATQTTVATSSNTTTGTFSGSCTVSISAGAISVTTCFETYYDTAANIQQACVASSGANDTATYSADHCPTAGLTGKCSISSGGAVESVLYYYNVSAEASSFQTSCANNGGTWSAS